MSIKWKIVLIAIISLGIWSEQKAQPFAFRTYSIGDGLPQSQVWCGFSDSRGFLWFGTQGGGLSRFDGQEFETFATKDGLPSNFVHSLYQDEDYRIWIGTNQGLCTYDGQRIAQIAGIKETILSIEALHDSILVLGTKKGLYSIFLDSISVERWSLDETLNNAEIYALAECDEEFYAATSNGLWRVWPEVQQLSKNHKVYDLDSHKDSLWIAVYGEGVFRLEEDALIPLGNNYRVSRPMSILKDSTGALYVGTQNRGLLRYDSQEKDWIIPEGQDLAQINVRDLLLDQSNRLWLCTSGGGIACRNRQNFQHYSRSDGLAGERVYALHRDTLNRLWMAISRRGIQVRDSSGFMPALLEPPLGGVKYKTICEDSLGQIWIGSEGRGIAVLDSSGWFQLDTKAGLPSNWILKLLTDSKGILWGATYSNGIFSVDRKGQRNYEIKTYGSNAGLKDLRISAFALDEDSKVWFATTSGTLGYIQNGRLKNVYEESNNLPPVAIRSLAFDQYQQIWVGTKGRGLYFAPLNIDTIQFTPLSSVQALAPQNVYLVLADALGYIWSGSENGVDRISLDSLGQVNEIKHFDASDGFLGLETCHDAFLTEAGGAIWFGTMNGLTHYAPGEEVLNCTEPALYFTDVALFYKPLRETEWADFAAVEGGIKKGLLLPFKENHLSFSFRAVSQIRAEEIRYRWKLLGADEDWSPPSGNRSVNYANLPPGNYRFQVQAAIADCPWTETLESEFSIASPFWQKKWFVPSIIAFAVLLISWIAWSVVRRIKIREKLQREKLEIQNRFLQLEQKALQLQMNPHFIFNALTGIQSLVAAGEYAKARKRINEFAKLMRGTLYNARKTSISLQEEIDALSQYLSIEQFCQAQAFTFKIELAEEIDPEGILLPPMLLQPFLENAVVHGVSHLSYPGHIDLRFDLKDDLLYIKIRDNGIGRKKAALLKEERKPGHQSVALKVNQERLEALRADRNYQALEILDITDQIGEINGTEVRVVVPVEHLY